MTAPTRIRLSRAKGWRLPEGAVVVSRPSRWGNPFVVGRDGTAAQCVESYKSAASGWLDVLSKASLEDQQALHQHVRDHLHELRGRSLACWCALYRPCHADALLEAAAALAARSEADAGV